VGNRWATAAVTASSSWNCWDGSWIRLQPCRSRAPTLGGWAEGGQSWIGYRRSIASQVTTSAHSGSGPAHPVHHVTFPACERPADATSTSALTPSSTCPPGNRPPTGRSPQAAACGSAGTPDDHPFGQAGSARPDRSGRR
jgi:hypothetical protein